VFISALNEYKRPANFSSNESEVLIIAYLSSVFKTELLDPIDKPPSLFKSCYWLLDMI